MASLITMLCWFRKRKMACDLFVLWNGRLLVGTTDIGYTPGEEMARPMSQFVYDIP
jgi:hypothetical protein